MNNALSNQRLKEQILSEVRSLLRQNTSSESPQVTQEQFEALSNVLSSTTKKLEDLQAQVDQMKKAEKTSQPVAPVPSNNPMASFSPPQTSVAPQPTKFGPL